MPAANRYTTTQLLAAIRRTGHIPVSQTPFEDDDILQIADQELQTGLLRQILSVRENFYLTYLDTAVNATGIYNIPLRAIGGALAEIQLLNGNIVTPIVRSEVHDQFSTNASPNGVYSFYLKANQVVILPIPTTGSIRLWYYQRPNELVPTDECSQISAISSGTLTVDQTATTSITTATPCDLIKDQPFFDSLATEITPSSVGATSIVFSSSDVPTTLSVGDWVALAGKTPVPQIPVEFRPLLVQRVVVKYYEIQGYLDKMKAAQKKLEDMEKDTFMLINPRVVEEPKTISPSCDLIGGYSNWRRWLVSSSS